jgi:thymidylate synthase
MSKKSFSNLNLAYKEILCDLITQGTEVNSTTDPMSIGSRFGNEVRKTKEIIGYSFAIEHPHERAIFQESKPINLPFAIANCIWTIAGSDSLDFINFYNDRGKQFSDDHLTLYGAHGKRLFNTDGINQIAAIINRLKTDPYSRRTVAAIYQPVDNQAVSRDIPCPIAIQFFQRDDKLHTVAYMRSQSAAMVLPYDVFVFTFLQEVLAVELGLTLGTYHHVCGSLHYYLDEQELVHKVLNEESISSSNIYIPAPQMPKTVSPLQMINTIFCCEEQIRSKIKHSSGKCNLDLPDMPNYWKEVLLILVIANLTKVGADIKLYLSYLPEYYSRHFCKSSEK